MFRSIPPFLKLLKKFKIMVYQFIKNKKSSPLSIDVLNMETNEIEYTIEEDRIEKVEKKKMGCLKKGCLFGGLGALILLLTGEVDIADDTGNNRPTNLILYDKNYIPVLAYKRARRGLEFYQGTKKVGSMKFEKISFIAKYEIYLHGKHIGKLSPDGLLNNKMDIKRGEKLMARFVKSKKRHVVGELSITKGGIAAEALQAYFCGLFLTWV